ncbi:hypothetical protein [Acaryochloris sp. IP29b_bin.137]|uniref:hypothetical protein n=1 Tax=Acaryochloris sp. IP29b_bin.137 TaxID=2969217 RepID=UPI0026168C91|nr:hypothetical protein [Acaryochloris sp. IP29b_bin.137]
MALKQYVLLFSISTIVTYFKEKTMALSKEQRGEVSKKLGELITKESADEIRSAGGLVWCEPCPYFPAAGCLAFIGDCHP